MRCGFRPTKPNHCPVHSRLGHTVRIWAHNGRQKTEGDRKKKALFPENQHGNESKPHFLFFWPEIRSVRPLFDGFEPDFGQFYWKGATELFEHSNTREQFVQLKKFRPNSVKCQGKLVQFGSISTALTTLFLRTAPQNGQNGVRTEGRQCTGLAYTCFSAGGTLPAEAGPGPLTTAHA